jgi:hypothetical protein
METPSLRQRWLGTKLTDLRVQAGLASLAEAAPLIGRSPASLSRIENGVVAIPPRDVPPILDAYHVNDQNVRDRLMVVAAEIQLERRGWWVEHGDLLSPSYVDLIRLEATAEEILTFEVQIVPGLLQTDAYAHAASVASWAPTQEELEHFVTVRMNRKNVLEGEHPTTLHVILNEAALRNPIGGKEVFRDQLQHLREWEARDHVTIQVLPFTDRAHPGVTGAFTILRLPSLDAVHVELMSSDAYVEDDHGVARYLQAFDRLSKFALTPGESDSFIAKVVDTL